MFEYLKQLFTKTEKIKKQEISKYPCHECLAQSNCSHLCNKLESDYDILKEGILKDNKCMDCGEVLQKSPGPVLITFICEKCDHRFYFSRKDFIDEDGLNK